MEEDICDSSGPRRVFEARRIDVDENITPSEPLVEHKRNSPPTSADTGDAVMLAGRSREPFTPSNIDLIPAPLPEHSTTSRTVATSRPDTDHGSVLLQGNTQIPSICVHHHSGAGAGDSHLLQDASSPSWCLGVPQLNRMAVTAPLNDVRFLTVPWSREHHCDELPRVDTRKRKMLLWLYRVYSEAYQALVSKGLKQIKKPRLIFGTLSTAKPNTYDHRHGDADRASTSGNLSSRHGPNTQHTGRECWLSQSTCRQRAVGGLGASDSINTFLNWATPAFSAPTTSQADRFWAEL
ncbi:hypothetical protein BDN71DRAFT_1495224 [Pleurotus eryngii]|uniref:Uncharacterized protein n=1 Tax=Pleurotus eryngii TaxID=5323 RepID=A0A9P5ZYD2_PLEER|nr:hypothetical protein BDN71DRAFT_1495224 [Pleurotus eryngii]